MSNDGLSHNINKIHGKLLDGAIHYFGRLGDDWRAGQNDNRSRQILCLRGARGALLDDLTNDADDEQSEVKVLELL